METYQKVLLPLFLERKPWPKPLFRVKQLKVFTKPATWNTPQEERSKPIGLIWKVFFRISMLAESMPKLKKLHTFSHSWSLRKCLSKKTITIEH